MQYVAIVQDEEREVEVQEIRPGQFRVRLDNRIIDMDVEELPGNVVSCIVDNEAYDIDFEKSAPDGGDNILIRGDIVHVEVCDLREMRLRQAQEIAGGLEGAAAIKSPMPGKVVAVLVEEGQEVTTGQGLVVVEAMKMENELKAPKNGVVENLTAKEGEAVDGGATLCTID